MTTYLKDLTRVISLFTLCLTAPIAIAQPAPLTMLVPFSAGGTVDIVARVVGQQLTKDNGTTVIVDNKVGAGGAIATAIAAKAKPNGQTILAHHQGIVYNTFLVSNLHAFPILISIKKFTKVLLVRCLKYRQKALGVIFAISATLSKVTSL